MLSTTTHCTFDQNGSCTSVTVLHADGRTTVGTWDFERRVFNWTTA